MAAFEAEAARKRELKIGERKRVWVEGLAQIDMRHQRALAQLENMALQVVQMESEVDPFYSEGHAGSVTDTRGELASGNDSQGWGGGDGGGGGQKQQKKGGGFSVFKGKGKKAKEKEKERAKAKAGGGATGGGGGGGGGGAAAAAGRADFKSGGRPTSEVMGDFGGQLAASKRAGLRTRDVAKYTLGQRLQSRQGVAGGLVTGEVVAVVADDGSQPARGPGLVQLHFMDDGDYEWDAATAPH
jgi:hypothetical protein